MDPAHIIHPQADAARGILEDFGPEKSMGYLIGEKFLNFLGVAETDRQWREAIPAFVAAIKALFEPLQLAEFLKTTRRWERWDTLPLKRRTGCSVTSLTKSSDFVRTPGT
jgi:hypothetical protein